MKNKSLTPVDWQRHVEQCRNQEVSQASYCRQHHLILSRFGYWHRKLGTVESSNWLPVEIEQAENTAIDLVLGKERTLRIADGFNVHLLQQIIIAVEATP